MRGGRRGLILGVIERDEVDTLRFNERSHRQPILALDYCGGGHLCQGKLSDTASPGELFLSNSLA